MQFILIPIGKLLLHQNQLQQKYQGTVFEEGFHLREFESGTVYALKETYTVYLTTQTTTTFEIGDFKQAEVPIEEFVNLDIIIPTPQHKQSVNQTVDIDKVLDVQSKIITKTHIDTPVIDTNSPVPLNLLKLNKS